uniref:Glucosidase 2 subunit beta n=1 Tax=Daphnia galeata TaxID=27404 RepID=A0A8J2RDD7_9CRUS|nr:unnamed protein product [Daphnia galeata]
MFHKEFRAIIFQNVLILCASAVLWKQTTVTATQLTRPRGVSLARASLYSPDADFTCLDGSATFPFRYVNDDYCDCQDGSDEPGTSACPNGSFYCRNLGHEAMIVPSSRVNDGICDCCDAADEYQSGANCVNTCKELGSAAQEEAQRKYELESQGYAIKLEYINKGRQAKLSQQERNMALKAEQVEAEALRAEKEREKHEAEEPEKQALDKYRQIEQEAMKEKEEIERSKQETEASKAFDWLDSNQDGKLQVEELQTHVAFDQNQDGTVTVEEAKFFLHNEEEMDKSDFIATGWPLIKPFIMKAQGLENPSKSDQQAGEIPLSDDHHQEESMPETEGEEEEEEEHEEEGETVKPSPVTPSSVEYDAETQELIEAANKARNAYDEADRRLRDLEREIRQLEESNSKDYGPNEEYQPMDGQCYEYSDREYTYKLCPFDSGSQRPKHGGSETRLGSWDSWDGPAANKYSAMKYDKGVQCWNGPQRSLKVHLSCGMENQLLSVSEPNRCEYEMKFTTPAACSEPKKPDEGDSEIHDEL